MEDDRIKHLEFIQNIITRMNANSFQIKGMVITIVSAFLAVYASTSNLAFVFIPILPTILFWFLDAYYLQQERKFRGVYDNASGLKNDIEVNLFAMPINKFKGDKYTFCNVLFSKTIIWLYQSIIWGLLIAGLIIKFKDCVFIFKCN